MSAIRRCRYFMTDHSINIVIKSLVLSHLDYCSVVWSCATTKDLQKLQLAQNKAARLALHCSPRTSVDSMHDALLWLKVKDRLMCNLLIFFRNVLFHARPKEFYAKILYINDRHNHTTRQATQRHIVVPTPKTSAIQKTVFYRASTYWNSIPVSLKKISNRVNFKKCLKKWVALSE